MFIPHFMHGSVYKLSVRERLIEYYVNVSRNFLKLKDNSDQKLDAELYGRRK